MEIQNFKKKVATYKTILKNTRAYRTVWKEKLRDKIINKLTEITNEAELDVEITTKSDFENLEAVILSLGDVKSGMYQEVSDSIKRHLIKHNGSLVYQQLFNGKVMVVVNYPFIENYGQPHPPKTIAIYRPDELREPFFVRHLEVLMNEITNWEDYDDDEPNQRIGFKMNFQQPAPERVEE